VEISKGLHKEIAYIGFKAGHGLQKMTLGFSLKSSNNQESAGIVLPKKVWWFLMKMVAI
jgi:hypothetical protein